MTPELTVTIEAMRQFGGGFTAHLANAIAAADPGNRRVLLDAFPDLIQKYGPATPFGQATPAMQELAHHFSESLAA